MPPKAKFTKAEIIEAALNIVRADGYEALTSRALGTYLGSSARPIFTVFKNMEEVQQDTTFRASPSIRRLASGSTVRAVSHFNRVTVLWWLGQP